MNLNPMACDLRSCWCLEHEHKSTHVVEMSKKTCNLHALIVSQFLVIARVYQLIDHLLHIKPNCYINKENVFCTLSSRSIII
jgi:hypothetical protein